MRTKKLLLCAILDSYLFFLSIKQWFLCDLLLSSHLQLNFGPVA